MSLRILLAALVVAPLFAQNQAERRMAAATEVFREIMETSDKTVPQDLLDRAHCAIVLPGVKKGGFIVAAKFGRGFGFCRAKSGAGWGPPMSFRAEGGSVGFQIGASESDIILLVMNRKGVDRLVSSQFTLGGDASVAAGPVGREATAQTDATMRAEILSYSRSRGAFAGVALQGATMRQDAEANRQLYGKEIENRAILDQGAQAPKSAAPLIQLLTKYSAKQAN